MNHTVIPRHRELGLLQIGGINGEYVILVGPKVPIRQVTFEQLGLELAFPICICLAS